MFQKNKKNLMQIAFKNLNNLMSKSFKSLNRLQNRAKKLSKVSKYKN